MAKSPPIPYSVASGKTLTEFLAGLEPGAVVDLPPGRYIGPFHFDKPLTLRGAGDLTRLVVEGRGSVLEVALEPGARAVFDSLALEGGRAEAGGGLLLCSGEVEARNLHITRCRAANGGGGAVAVLTGHADLSRIRIEHVESVARGGAIRVSGEASLTLVDGQIHQAQAQFGGALSIEDNARVTLERLTISRCRATTSVGGQAIYVAGSELGTPNLVMKRVRLTDTALWSPLVHDRLRPGEVIAEACDMPRLVLKDTGIVDRGDNLWR